MHIGFILAASDIFPTALLPHLDHETGPDTIALSYFLVHIYLFTVYIFCVAGWLAAKEGQIRSTGYNKSQFQSLIKNHEMLENNKESATNGFHSYSPCFRGFTSARLSIE